MCPDATFERFKEIVRGIDLRSKAGDHARALGMLPGLLAVERDDPRYSMKKSHFIAALAFRAVQAGEREVAFRFLDLADRELPDEHMIPFLREERWTIREAATGPGPGVGGETSEDLG